MKIIVLKFGGTSVGTLRKITKVAKVIASYAKKKYKVIVVSSAMSGVTNQLLLKTKKISQNFPNEEKDVNVAHADIWFVNLNNLDTPENKSRVQIWIPIIF